MVFLTYRVVLLPDVGAVLHALDDHVEVVVEDRLVEDLLQPQAPPSLVALLKRRRHSELLNPLSHFEFNVPRM